MVYLLHFNSKIGNQANQRAQAQHYIGWTPDELLEQRIEEHHRGNGAKITAYCTSHSVDFVVARMWRGDYHLEKKLKARKEAPRFCPICKLARRKSGGIL